MGCSGTHCKSDSSTDPRSGEGRDAASRELDGFDLRARELMTASTDKGRICRGFDDASTAVMVGGDVDFGVRRKLLDTSPVGAGGRLLGRGTVSAEQDQGYAER